MQYKLTFSKTILKKHNLNVKMKPKIDITLRIDSHKDE